MIYPYLSYGIPLWGAAADCHLNKLIVLQKKAVRSISGASYIAHTNPILKLLNILKLKDIYHSEIIKFVYSFIRGEMPNSISTFFSLSHTIHAHQTRHSINLKLEIPCARTQLSSSSPIHMGSRLWNSLSSDIYLRPQALVSERCLTSRLKKSTICNY